MQFKEWAAELKEHLKQDEKPEDPEEYRDAVLIAMLENPEHAEEIAQWASENGADSLEESSEHGPPPSPGLVFDEGKHRWVRPESADAAPDASHALEGLADKLPEEAKSPGTWGKIKSFVASAGSAIYTGAAALGHKLHDIAPDVLDVAADYAKIFYAGRGSGRGDTPDPFVDSLGFGANTVAVVASHVLGRASVWLRNKIGGKRQESQVDWSEAAGMLAEMFAKMHADLGLDMAGPTEEELADYLRERMK